MSKLSDLAKKVGKGFEKAVNSIPTDEEMIKGFKKGLDNLEEGIGKVDSKVAKGLKDVKRKLRDDPSPQNLGEVADDLKGLAKGLKSDLKSSKVKDKLLDFLGAAVDLVKSIGGTPKDRQKAFGKFNESAQKLGEAIGKAFGKAKDRLER